MIEMPRWLTPRSGRLGRQLDPLHLPAESPHVLEKPTVGASDVEHEFPLAAKRGALGHRLRAQAVCRNAVGSA